MITAQIQGRLGNQMFQYALCRCIALKNNFNFYIERNYNTLNDLFLFQSLESGKIDGNILYQYTEELSQSYNSNIFNIKDFTRISGFFQTEKYFIPYKDEIKKWFTPYPLNTLEVSNILQHYNIDNYCFIHFRGGDYKDIKSWYLPIEYYQRAISYIKTINANLNFVVITDDIPEAKKYFPEYTILSNRALVDFSVLYYSKYCIISNSSFSWWATWLTLENKNTIVAPIGWFNYGNINGFSPADIKTNGFIYV